jgi:cytochrome o ubiquinol oxidase subunit 1
MSEQTGVGKLVFGRLNWDSLAFLHDPILLVTFVAVAFGAVCILAAITYFRAWGTLWRDWITSIDHKKIGIMYVILGLVMLLRGFSDAIMMRAQQAVAFGEPRATCRRTTTTRSSPRTA